MNGIHRYSKDQNSPACAITIIKPHLHLKYWYALLTSDDGMDVEATGPTMQDAVLACFKIVNEAEK